MQMEARSEPTESRQRLAIDMEVSLDAVDQALFTTLEQLKPFGETVPEPVFMARDAEIVSQQIVGGRHRRMRLRSRNGRNRKPLPAIQFNVADGQRLPARPRRIAFHVRRHTWNGANGHQLHIIAAEA